MVHQQHDEEVAVQCNVSCILSTVEGFHQIISMDDTATLHQYRPIENLFTDPHFIYITARGDENKEESKSYYKLMDDDMEKITKEWPEEFLVPIDDTELSNTKTIGSPIVTQVEYVRQSSGMNNKKK
jgi:hypothetical protein